MLGVDERQWWPNLGNTLRITLAFGLFIVLLLGKGVYGGQNFTKKEVLSPKPLSLSCNTNNLTSIFELYKDGLLVTYARSFENGSISQYHKPGQKPVFEVSAGNKLTFILEKTEISYQGKYVCLSKQNNITIFKSSYQVTIYGAPTVKIRNDIKVLSVYETQSAELRCFAEGHPLPSIKWLRSTALAANGAILPFSIIRSIDAGVYTCVAKNRFGNKSVSVTVRVKIQVPGNPNNFTAIDVKELSVTFSWLAAAKGRTPILEYILSSKDIKPPERKLAPNTHTTTIDGLTGSTNYTFSLKACNSFGCGAQVQLKVTTLEENPPTRPTNVQAQSITSTSIKLTWTPGKHSSRPIYRHTIFYREASEFQYGWTLYTFTIPYTVKKLKPFTTYVFKIATCVRGTSGELCSKFPFVGFTYMTKMAAPSEVCCLSVKNTDSEQLQLLVKWGPPFSLNGPNVTYKIFYKLKNETIWKIIHLSDGRLRSRSQLSSDSFAHTITGLHGPLEYEVMVNAANPLADSNSSVVAVRTDEPVPGRPVDLDLVSRTSSSLVITWKPPPHYMGKISGYHLTVYNLRDPKPTASVTKKAEDTTIGSLSEDTKYRVEVHATVVRSRDGKLLNSPKIFKDFRTSVKEIVMTHTRETADTTLIIVTVICIVVMIVVVVVTLLYCRKKNVFGVTYKSTFYVLPESGLRHSFRLSMRKPVQRQPVGIEEFNRYMAQMHADSDYLFSEEYGSLQPRRPGLSYEHSSSQLNKPKNRYPDIVAYDHSRVRLMSIDGVPASNYINANFVDGYKRKNAFIATQAPLTRTFEDFWRMVVEQGVRVIIMLTNLMERGRRKCDQYWPNEGTQHYGTISVQTTEERKYAYFTVRTFVVYDDCPSDSIEKTDEQCVKREIKQFHFTDWPDFDVPRERSTIMTFIWWIRRYSDQFQKPMVCHCSAGVGRTGTLIVLDAQIRRVDEERTVDVYNFLRHIRAQRNYLVQQERQYVFIHDALLDYIRSGRTEHLRSKLRESVLSDSFISIQGKEKSKLETEWEAINAAVLGDYEMQVGRRPCNIPKNRDQFVIPVDVCRVRLTVRAATEDTDYINASYIDTFLDKKSIIVAQSPLRDTVEDFWRMIWENYSVIVVNLLSEQDCAKEDYSDYMPRDNCNPINFGVFEVNCVSDVKVGVIKKRELEITHRVPWGESEKRKVYHFQFLNWTEDSYPPPSELFEFMEAVKTKQDELHCSKGKVDKAPVVVHCSCGIGKSGIYGVMVNVKEQLEDQEGVVDVFTSVKITRRQRPYFIQTIEQYQYCYKATVEFSDLIRQRDGVKDLIEIAEPEREERPKEDPTSKGESESLLNVTEPSTEGKAIPENGFLSNNSDTDKNVADGVTVKCGNEEGGESTA